MRVIGVCGVYYTAEWIDQFDDLTGIGQFQHSAYWEAVIVDKICLDITHGIIRRSFE